MGGTVVWRQFCRVEHSTPCAELVAGDYDRVKQLRGELARRCAADLSRSLAGR